MPYLSSIVATRPKPLPATTLVGGSAVTTSFEAAPGFTLIDSVTTMGKPLEVASSV